MIRQSRSQFHSVKNCYLINDERFILATSMHCKIHISWLIVEVLMKCCKTFSTLYNIATNEMSHIFTQSYYSP